MSYSISLLSQHKNQRIDTAQLEVLKQVAEIDVISYTSDNNVESFYAKIKDVPEPDWLDEGLLYELVNEPMTEYEAGVSARYETNISGSDGDPISYAMNLTLLLAECLGWEIFDPQFRDQPVSTDDFATCVEEFVPTKKFLYHSAVPTQQIYTSPASITYFIQYLIYSLNPNTSQYELLVLEGNQTYCSKVKKGQMQNDVLSKEVPLLIGTTDYTLVYTSDGGVAQNKFGEWLPRFDLTIYTPYFDPSTRQLIKPSFWTSDSVYLKTTA